MFTSDVSTDIGKVRLLIRDTTEATAIFTDDNDIQAFLDIEGTIKSAAALALETIAGDQVLRLKSIAILDIKMDGPAVAEALLATAQRFRDSDDGDGDECGFDIAEQLDNSTFAMIEKRSKLLLQELA
jgi:hypothetical protein